jgi:ATP-binding cassette subfamily F protein 3
MLTVSNVAKSYGAKTLFEDLTLQINHEDRIGLVGPNGAGKSTLFKLILQQEEPDAGDITFQRGITVGFLPQESAPAGDETVVELATTFPGADGSSIAKAKRILKGLAFRDTDFERPARELSGGWVMRAHLARLLTQEPDLLMLDEPTNHLDLESLLWFQEYLESYPGGIVMISHDREFLNRLVTQILEIRNSKLHRYVGNYDNYLTQRAARAEQQLAAYKNQQRDIARLQEFADRFRAKASKASQAQSKLKQIERMEKIEAPEAEAGVVSFSFPQPESSGHRVITLRDLGFAYGSHVVYQRIHFEAERGQRVVLVGPNGAGKSTLLKLLAGVLTPNQGERDLGPKVKAGYYSQYRTEMLQPGRTVLAEALDTPARVTELSVRSLLGCFLFRDDDVFKKVSVLSGGEKSRLALVKLLLDPPNFLLMDEPTTHLDIASIDAVIAALKAYTGTLVFISHDVYFIRALATKVVHVNAGQLTPYAGGYDYYLEKTKAGSARAALTAGLGNGRPAGQTTPTVSSPEESAQSQKDRKQQQAEARKLVTLQKKIVTELEQSIAHLETEQAELVTALENPETYKTPGRGLLLNSRMIDLTRDLAAKNQAWEAAAARLSQLEAT